MLCPSVVIIWLFVSFQGPVDFQQHVQGNFLQPQRPPPQEQWRGPPPPPHQEREPFFNNGKYENVAASRIESVACYIIEVKLTMDTRDISHFSGDVDYGYRRRITLNSLYSTEQRFPAQPLFDLPGATPLLNNNLLPLSFPQPGPGFCPPGSGMFQRDLPPPRPNLPPPQPSPSPSVPRGFMGHRQPFPSQQHNAPFGPQHMPFGMQVTHT